MFIPVLGCLNLHFGIGGEIKDLTLGVISHEVKSINECFNQSLKTYELVESECVLQKTSCRFIKELNDGSANLVS